MGARFAVWSAMVSLLFGVLLVLPAEPAAAAAPACRNGLVALTFDDGPAPKVTAHLLDTLDALGVKATFFMVGSRVAASPKLARSVARRGHVIANHTWDHPQLPRLGDAAIRWQLDATRYRLRREGLQPSRLMRPPYGAINDRVRRVVRSRGLVPVLWDIDTRDWEGGGPRTIADRVLARLRPHRRNIVLQHDGVRRSPNSVAAVTRIVRVARARGFCFSTLDDNGRVAPPVPHVQMSVTRGAEKNRVPITVRLRLDRPTSRITSLLLTASPGTAQAGQDFVARHIRVRFPVGAREAVVHVGVLDDDVVEPPETVRVTLSSPRGLVLPRAGQVAGIVSDDAAPPPPPPPPSPPPTGTGSPEVTTSATAG